MRVSSSMPTFVSAMILCAHSGRVVNETVDFRTIRDFGQRALLRQAKTRQERLEIDLRP